MAFLTTSVSILPRCFLSLVRFLAGPFSKSAFHGASVLLLRLSFMEGFRVGERERLLPTGERNCRSTCIPLNSSVPLE